MIYSKTGGKNGKLAHIEDAGIDAISNIAVQMFEHIFNSVQSQMQQ